MKPNPLLKKQPLPDFKNIKTKDIEPALDTILKRNRAKLKKLLIQKKFTWNNLMAPYAKMDDDLHQMWSPASHLNGVMNSDALRKTYEKCLPKIIIYGAELDHNIELYRAMKSINQNKLNSHQQRVIKNYLRNFKLAGVSLPEKKKKEFMQLEQRAAELMNQFSNNILDATQAWNYQATNKKELSGIPEQFITQAKQLAKTKHKKGWLFSLDMPTFNAVMTYADSQKMREKMYHAFVTRASDQGPNAKKFDNSKLIDEILSIRYKLSDLVGFKNYADYSLSTKMAKNSNDVLGFINDLIKRSLPTARKEARTLKQFAKKHYRVETLQAWDIAYYSEKMQQHLFDISQEKLRPYFQETKVLTGMFSLVEKLFNIKIKEKLGTKSWHKDVRYFQIFDTNKKLRGSFYVDLYARPKKRGGAWMDDCRIRYKVSAKKIQLPVAYLICNFSKPAAKQPSLLTHDEVITLFHEFGHCLQHLMTKIDYPEISGINGVEWDAVEFSSQLLENFCWQKPIIKTISEHHKTKKSLPDEMLKQLIASKNFQSGLHMLRQLNFALFDFRIHNEYSNKLNVQKILDNVRKKTSVFETPSYNRFQHSFSHIFAGGYAAGYYSYKWAEVLSSDGFELFQKHGLFDKTIGKSFLKNILETGGSENALTLFKKFRGRKPKIDALLKSSGIGQHNSQ